MKVLQEEVDAEAVEARNERARQMFEEVQAEHSGTAAAAIADVYLGEIAADQGALTDAREHWESFLEGRGDDMLAATVRVNLMTLDRAEGRSEELAGRLREELAGAGSTLPADVLLYQLALTQEDLGDDEGARATWTRLAEEQPTSPYAAEAARRSGAGSGLPMPGATFPGA